MRHFHPLGRTKKADAFSLHLPGKPAYFFPSLCAITRHHAYHSECKTYCNTCINISSIYKIRYQISAWYSYSPQNKYINYSRISDFSQSVGITDYSVEYCIHPRKRQYTVYIQYADIHYRTVTCKYPYYIRT